MLAVGARFGAILPSTSKTFNGTLLHTFRQSHTAILFHKCKHTILSRKHVHNSVYTTVCHRYGSSRSATSPFTASDNRPKLNDEPTADAFVEQLRHDEQRMLLLMLQKRHDITDVDPPNGGLTKDTLRTVFLINALPFLGFGFLDNFIMIIAGEYIDATLGVAFGMSTMAAAGFGNLISDVFGVSMAHYVEVFCDRVLGIRPPALTSEQLVMNTVRYTAAAGKVLGLVIGCLIGMCPLLFYETKKEKEEK